MKVSKTLVIWWRYGKEHSEEDFRVNPPEVIAAHLDQKLANFRSVPEHLWRWWQINDNLIVERPDPTGYGYGPDTIIYYLLKRGLTIIKNIHLPKPNDGWKWYLHLADIFFDSGRECWIKKDLFCDIVIDHDGRYHRVLDLADLAEVLAIGLVSPPQASAILRRMDSVLKAIAEGLFPFPEILEGQAICRQLGWL
jgi:hypothetical protein